MARPRKKLKVVSTRVYVDEYNDFQQLSKRLGERMSSLLRDMIVERVELEREHHP